MNKLGLLINVLFVLVVLYALGIWSIPLVLWFNRDLVASGVKKALLYYAYKRNIPIRKGV